MENKFGAAFESMKEGYKCNSHSCEKCVFTTLGNKVEDCTPISFKEVVSSFVRNEIDSSVSFATSGSTSSIENMLFILEVSLADDSLADYITTTLRSKLNERENN